MGHVSLATHYARLLNATYRLPRQALENRALLSGSGSANTRACMAALQEEMGLRKSTTTTAYHEAGHAVLAWLYGVPFDYAQIGEESDANYVKYPAREFRSVSALKNARNRRAYSSAGGPLAEALYYEMIGKPYYESLLWSPSDFEGLGDFCNGPDSYCAETHPVTWAVKEVLARQDVRMAIAAVAGQLLAAGRVTAEQVARVASAHIVRKGKLPSATMAIQSQRQWAALEERPTE